MDKNTRKTLSSLDKIHEDGRIVVTESHLQRMLIEAGRFADMPMWELRELYARRILVNGVSSRGKSRGDLISELMEEILETEYGFENLGGVSEAIIASNRTKDK